MNEVSKYSKMKSKENLYALFYEIISEIKGCKIEIEEEEFQENIESIQMSQLIHYIKDSLRILIEKKIHEVREKQKKEDFKKLKNLNNLKENELQKYEKAINKLEQKERYLVKLYFKGKLNKEAMENKISEYMDMEDEYEEMKSKLKNEDRRIVNNNKKDDEIVNLRKENTNLKIEIKEKKEMSDKIENIIFDKEKEIEILKNELENLKNKLIEKEKELNLFSNININITNNNNNQQSKNSNYNYSTNNTTKMIPNTTKNNINKSLRNSHSMKAYLLKKIKSKNNFKNKKNDSLNNTRNEIINREYIDFLSKNSTSINKSQNNSSCNNSNIKIKKIEDKNLFHKNNFINPKFPNLNKQNQMNIFSYMNKSNLTSRKKTSNSNINYFSILGD